MLLSIKVRNYALIEELNVDFQKGLNIITGETGAGKSILLGALGLILGKRADTSVISNKEGKCVVEAEFNISGYKLESYFIENDIDFEPHTVIRREILNTGKSRAFINDTPVTLNVLQDISGQLVDIHSQHQNLMLNKDEFILQIIDAFAGNGTFLIDYQKSFTEYKVLERDYHNKLKEYNRTKEEKEFIEHQFNELEAAKLAEGELLSLEQELSELENAGDIKLILHEATSLLEQEEAGILDKLSKLESRLGKISGMYSKADGMLERIQSVIIELKDLHTGISDSFESLEFDPGRHELVHARLDLLNTLLQKYRCSEISELIVKHADLQAKLSIVVDGEYELNKLKKELESSRAKIEAIANTLMQRRTDCFPALIKNIKSLLSELGLEHAQLTFERDSKELSPDGTDVIQFLFSANKNHPLQEISKVASGGELSRLMLAIKSILAGSTGMPTLILDEIDTGVSGEIADKVGKIISSMSSNIQIINITHLPQVASKGEVHFLVYKDHQSDLSKTLIKQLNEEERLFEIAKMLSGEKLTDAALENAKVLLGM
ncbi:MAG: DNA repair protein RecN [Bacteroidales bacterium]|nr:DNA repair protein RecN [Bacteroidales bacterium]MBN2817369.1 DNA repair protein RecN [Bacteroidales bacterium]